MFLNWIIHLRIKVKLIYRVFTMMVSYFEQPQLSPDVNPTEILWDVKDNLLAKLFGSMTKIAGQVYSKLRKNYYIFKEI